MRAAFKRSVHEWRKPRIPAAPTARSEPMVDMAGVEPNCYVSRSCQTDSVTGFQYSGSGDGITDELVECCQKLLQAPTDPRYTHSGPEEAPARPGRRRNGASDADASAPASGGRRFRLIGFLSRLHKPKPPAEKTRPRWSARARQRFHKLASWVHALRLALRIPGEIPAPKEDYHSPAAAEGEHSAFVEVAASEEDDTDSWPPDRFQDIPL
ncbi:uncharacterized protein [Dermacentor albipictus]|uniref:uncharacterized protein isoform X1 n=1 Tax=Dermacentor albipictus TaxID=60249 RepID=UPI0031FD4ADB